MCCGSVLQLLPNNSYCQCQKLQKHLTAKDLNNHTFSFIITSVDKRGRKSVQRELRGGIKSLGGGAKSKASFIRTPYICMLAAYQHNLKIAYVK